LSYVNDKVLKISLVGNSNVGKTSLLQRYIKNNFSNEYSRTIGMNSETKIYQFQEHSFKINLNDYIGGNGEFRPMPRSYLHCEGILLCFDLTNKNSFQKLDFWMELIKNNQNEGTLIWLIGNKSDLVDFKEVKDEEIQSFVLKHQLQYFNVSSKIGDDVKETFDIFIKQIIENNQLKYFQKTTDPQSTCEIS
jgi:small GTP-binding protein